jgi:MFS family permease
LGVLTSAGKINVQIIALSAFLSGVLLSFDQPARAALISTLVPERDLLSAISLQSAVFNGAAVAGPALAGFIVAHIGLPANFYLNAASYIFVLLALLLIRVQTGTVPGRESLREQILAAIRTVRGDAVLWTQLCAYGMLLFVGPSLPLLIPVLAAGRLHVGPEILGFLFSAAGLGAVGGSVGLARYSSASPAVVKAAFASWCLALVVTAMSHYVPLTFSALTILGASQSIAGATTSALLQTRVMPQQRGRVMSLNTLLVMGVRPLGDFPAGAAIGMLGAPTTALASALLVATTAGILFEKGCLNPDR